MSKKYAKSAEEFLEEALIPEEEQPYKVPTNWVWVSFGSVARLINGYAFKSNDYCEEGIPVIRISDIKGMDTNCDNAVKVPVSLLDEKFLIRRGDLLIAMSGATTGKTGIYESDEIALQNQRVGNIKEIDENVLYSKYKNYFVIKSSEEIYELSYGGAQPNISGKMIEALKFPLPPLNEQKRIADKVERLLDKINQAKQLIEEAKETFELRRAAILGKAFRGELTREWRLQRPNYYNSIDWLNEIGVSQPSSIDNEPYALPKGWSWVKFSDVSTIMSNLVDPSNYRDYPHIAPDNIERNSGKLLEYVTIGEARVTSPKHFFKEGQILYSKIRPYLSKLVVAPFDGLCSADMYPITTKLDTEYLFWLMLSSYFLEKASTAGSRSVLPKINQKELGAIMLPVCHYEEQIEVVSVVRSMLEKEQEAINLIEQSMIPLESTLNKVLEIAFSGKLGTNDPNEESPVEILRKIL